MAQIDHCISDEMTTQEIHILMVESDQQGAKFVNPSKRSLTGETPPIDFRVK